MSSTTPSGPPSRTGRRSPLGVLLVGFLTVSLVAGVLMAGLVLPAAGAAGLLARDGMSMFNSLDAQLEDMPLPEGSTMYASDGKTVIARFYEENRVVTPLSRVAPVMQQAIVAIEDSRFFEHGGVDPKGLVRAVVSNELNDGQVQGASTLTQQYVKNVLLESAVAAGDQTAARNAVVKTNARKIREIRMALQYEQDHSKEEILEGYLNIANFGQNNYGVEAASRYFFSTSAAKLTLPQAALLAGLVQIPETYNPFRHPEAATERRRAVLTRMSELGMITQEEFAEADAAELPNEPNRAKSGCVSAIKEFGYFCDYAVKMLLSDPRYASLGKTDKERLNIIKRGGLKIVTTVDAKLQKAATQYLMKRIPAADASGVAAAAVTVEPGTGKVLAIAQNRIFNPEKGPGQTEVSYGVDGKYGASLGFQVGSNFKPFTLATWLSKNKGLYTNVNGDIKRRPFSDFTACGQRLSGQTYEFDNSEGRGQATIDVMSATYRSVNTAYVDIESRLDLCDIAKTSEKLGVHLASVPFDNSCHADGKPSTKVPTQCPSLTLGSFNISPMTMANAYAVFASEGTYCPPTPVEGLTDRSGEPMAVGKTECDDKALPVNVARGVTYALKNVFTRGTATNVGRTPWPAAGKTGTTDASIHTWFTGYTKQRATSVVVTDPKVYKSSTLSPGIAGQRSLNNRRIGGDYYYRVYGSTIAAPLWRQIMGVAMDGLPDKDWKKPTGKVLTGSGIPVANVAGRTIGEASAILGRQGFRVRVASPVTSSLGADRVARTSPAPGGRLERGSTVTLYPGDGSQAPPAPPEPPQVNDGGNGNGNDQTKTNNGNGNGNGNGRFGDG